MRLDPEIIQLKAMEILDHLVRVIGPRPAGSPHEMQALDWLEEQFRSAHLQTRRFPVRFQPEPDFAPYFSIAAIGFALVALTLESHGWVTLFLPLLILILPEGMQWLQGKLIPFRDGSSNLLVLPQDSGLQDINLIYCAHIDSARAIPAGPRLWKKWRDRSLYTMMRVANILIIPGLFQWMGMDIRGLILTLGQSLAWAMAALLLAQDIYEMLASRNRFSPGANDNGSGVSLLAATALALADDKPAGFRTAFLFTGAEECGLHGAKQFAEYMNEQGLKIPVINVDMVGAGSGLRIITRCGTIRPTISDPELNENIKRADPTGVYHAAPRRWGDFVPFAKAGIPSAHIENTGTPLSWSTYHTPDDTLDVIDPEQMGHVADVMLQLIWILEKNKSNPVK